MLFTKKKNRRIIEIIIDQSDESENLEKDNMKTEKIERDIKPESLEDSKGDTTMVSSSVFRETMLKFLFLISLSLLFSLVFGNSLLIFKFNKYTVPKSLYSFVSMEFIDYTVLTIFVFLVFISSIFVNKVFQVLIKWILIFTEVFREIAYGDHFEVYCSFLGSVFFSLGFLYILYLYNYLNFENNYLDYLICIVLSIAMFLTYKWFVMSDHIKLELNSYFSSLISYIAIMAILAGTIAFSNFNVIASENPILTIKSQDGIDEFFDFIALKEDRVLIKSIDASEDFRIIQINDIDFKITH